MAACCRRGAGRGPARTLVPRGDRTPRLAGARAAPRSASPPPPAPNACRRRDAGDKAAAPGRRVPRPPAPGTKWSRPGAAAARAPQSPGPARPGLAAPRTKRPPPRARPGPARSIAASPGGPARPKAADCECPRPPRRWRRGRRREETDISFELKWSRFRSDHWPKRDTNLQCSPGWLPSPIGCLVGQKMAAKEPVPARSSTSRTRPPLHSSPLPSLLLN